MKLDKTRLDQIYQTLNQAFLQELGEEPTPKEYKALKLKTVAKHTFIKLKDAMELDDFDQALSCFSSYAQAQIKGWLRWEHASMNNLPAFLNSKNKIEAFAKVQKAKAVVKEKIVGYGGEDTWTF